MRLPTKLKIRNSVWRVKPDKKIIDSDNAVGLCNYRRKILYIYPDQSNDDIQETLVHEILHAIFPNNIVGIKTEEKLVTELARDLHQVLKKNRHKLKFR